MGIKGVVLFLVAVLQTCVLSARLACPPREDRPHCYCSAAGVPGTLEVHCRSYSLSNYKKLLLDLFPNVKLRLTFSGYSNDTSLPSNFFEGIDVQSLTFDHCNFSKWADNDGEAAFVGLEDTLEELIIIESFKRPRKHENYYEETAPLSVGHLRRLRHCKFSHNLIWNFGNEWFGNGGSSVEVLELDNDEIYELGDRPFAGLVNLKKFRLQNNKILKVSRSILPNLVPNLKVFDMSWNVLRDLPLDMFDNMPTLKHIEVSGNHLKYLRERTFKPVWSQLDFLYFDPNELSCNEHIDWLLKEKPPKYLLLAFCLSPNTMEGTDLNDLIKAGKRPT